MRRPLYHQLPSRRLIFAKLTPIVHGAVYRRYGIPVVLDDESTFHCCLLVGDESLLLITASSTHDLFN